MHNLFHINTMQTVKRTATEHTSSESKNMDPLAKKGRIRTEGQIHPPQQSTLLPFTHIISPVCIWKVLTLTFFFFLKKEIRQHKHWDPLARRLFLQSKAFVFPGRLEHFWRTKIQPPQPSLFRVEPTSLCSEHGQHTSVDNHVVLSPDAVRYLLWWVRLLTRQGY